VVGFLIASLALGRYRLDDVRWMVGRPARAAGLLAAGLAAVVLLVSHDALERKTSYGMTFLLTGTGVFGLDGSGIRAAVQRFYAGLSWPALLELKRRQVESLAWTADPFFAGFCAGVSALGCARVTEFFALLPSLGPAWLVLAARALLFLPRRRGGAGDAPEGEVIRDLRLLAPLSLATILVMIAVFNVPMVTPHIPYAVILGVLLGPLTFVPVLSSAGSRGAVLAVQIANLVLVWMIGAWWMWHMVIGVD